MSDVESETTDQQPEAVPAPVAAAAAAPVPAATAPKRATSSNSAGAKKTILKVILLGQAGAGKTSLLNRFVDDTYHPLYKATLGADMRDIEVTINDEPVILQIWDTAGQERFNSLTQLFLKGANMCLLVFDMTNANSFESLSLWREQFLTSTRNDATFPFACVANKCDAARTRAVSQRRANTWCSTNGDIPYTEASAKEGTNVHQAFMDLARKAMKQLQAERIAEQAAFATPPPKVDLTQHARSLSSAQKPPKKKSTSSCCA